MVRVLERKQVYEVEVRERREKYPTSWDVEVVASSLREARRLGVEALAKRGTINKLAIIRTSVHCSGQDVWVAV